MSLRDPKRAFSSFEVDEPVRRALALWGKEPDRSLARLHLARAWAKLNDEQKRQLVERISEISLGMLFVVLETE